MQQTQFQPLGDRILILPDVIEEKTKGGIIIPEKAKERPVRGTVITVGPGRWSEELQAYVPPSVNPGDEVLYSQFAGTDITVDGGQYVIMRSDDVFGKWASKQNNGKAKSK